MPLPDAPIPQVSNLYRQLNSIKLGDLTNEQYEVVYNNIFLNDTSEDELRRLALIGLARQSFSPSSSGPTRDFVTVNTVVTSSGDKAAVWGGYSGLNATDINGEDLTFPKDTVWQCMGASWYVSGISGSVNHDVWFMPSSSPPTDQTATLIADVSSTGGNQPLFSYNSGRAVDFCYVGDDNTLWVEASGTFTKVEYSFTFVRVR
jgi:hypothetical protein